MKNIIPRKIKVAITGCGRICKKHIIAIISQNERCELKDTIRSTELDMRTPLNYNRRDLPIHQDDPFYDRDYNLCIVCVGIC